MESRMWEAIVAGKNKDQFFPKPPENNAVLLTPSYYPSETYSDFWAIE